MKSGTALRTWAVALFALLAIAAQSAAWGQTYATFDPQGSISTTPVAINPLGQITGFYDDTSSTHGFVRATDGTLSSFDPPGSAATFPNVITPKGVIAGIYFDATFNEHIFLRQPSGATSDLEIPNLGGFPFIPFASLFANTEGEIAGLFQDATFFNLHLFLRTADGQVTVSDLPPLLTSGFFFPNVSGINAGGEIVGSYTDTNFVTHGFLRAKDGTFTFFDIPNEFPGIGGIQPDSINNAGTVAGLFFDASRNTALRGFLRAANGSYTTFDIPPNGSFGGVAVNSSGAVTGNVTSFIDCTPNNGCAGSLTLSFVRSPKGILSAVSPPGEQNTNAVAINPAGVVTGNYSGADNVTHGFVRMP